jgi:hypothetical protein
MNTPSAEKSETSVAKIKKNKNLVAIFELSRCITLIVAGMINGE